MMEVAALWKGAFLPAPTQDAWSASRWPGSCCR